jgi:hypothetical protein
VPYQAAQWVRSKSYLVAHHQGASIACSTEKSVTFAQLLVAQDNQKLQENQKLTAGP